MNEDKIKLFNEKFKIFFKIYNNFINIFKNICNIYDYMNNNSHDFIDIFTILQNNNFPIIETKKYTKKKKIYYIIVYI